MVTFELLFDCFIIEKWLQSNQLSSWREVIVDNLKFNKNTKLSQIARNYLLDLLTVLVDVLKIRLI